MQNRSDGEVPPMVTVIVAVHDVAAYVRDCLFSLAEQTFSDFEVLVIDDGSTDGSGNIAKACIAGDDRFQVLRQANAGLSIARNTGLDRARGNWIAFVDGDDRVAPRWLEDLLAAAKAADAPWAFCGLFYCPLPGDRIGPEMPVYHSAVHDAPDAGTTSETVHDLSNWREIVRLFPSAWNKIYRRDLIGSVRFEPGRWYEDHTFFWQMAANSNRIGRTAAPLYWQTRGRPGQITATADMRVMDQVAVLGQFPPIAAASGKPGAREAHARLLARLAHERAEILVEPGLRSRFLDACRMLALRFDLDPDPGPETHISRPVLRRLAGTWPLSVIIPLAADAPSWALSDTLASLQEQTARDIEVIVVHDGLPSATTRSVIETWRRRLPCLRQATGRWRGIAAARNTGLMAARGDFVTFLDAGDRIGPPAYEASLQVLLREGSIYGRSAFHVGDPHHPKDRLLHTGFHDTTNLSGDPVSGPVELTPEMALQLHPHPTPQIFRRTFLRDRGLLFSEGPLSSWEFTIRGALQARACLYEAESGYLVDDRPERRRIWRHAPTPDEIVQNLDRLGDISDKLPSGWKRRLCARAAWEKTNFANVANRDAYRALWAACPEIAAWRTGQEVPLDPYLDSWSKWLVTGIETPLPPDCA